MAEVNVSDIRELIDIAEILCETVNDQPAGCEACHMFDEEDSNFECPLQPTINRIKEQL